MLLYTILLLNICFASSFANYTIDQQCKDCIRNGSFVFYKRIHWANLPASYACRRPCDAHSGLDWTVGKFCTQEECSGVDELPITTILHNLECPANPDVILTATSNVQPNSDGCLVALLILFVINFLVLGALMFNMIRLFEKAKAEVRKGYDKLKTKIEKRLETFYNLYCSCPSCGCTRGHDTVD